MTTNSNPPDPSRENRFSPEHRLHFGAPLWINNLGTFGRLFGVLFALATLVLAFYVEEKARGSWALHRKVKQLESQGVSLEVKQLVSPAVPEEKNFARSELLRPLYDFTSAQTNRDPQAYTAFEKQWASLNTELQERGYAGNPSVPGYWRKLEWPDPIEMLGDPQKISNGESPRSIPLPEQAAQMILELFEQTTGPLLDELQKEALKRPAISFDIPYDVEMPYAILLPHLAKLKMLAQQCSVRSMAELLLKQSTPAYQDAQLGLFLSEGLKNEPFLISILVRIAMREIVLTPVWYGMATRQWNANQLMDFQKQFETVDAIEEMRRSIKAEMILGNRLIETFRRKFPYEMNFRTLGDVSAQSEQDHYYLELESVLNYLYPKGWLYFEQANYLDIYKKHILDPAMASPVGRIPAVSRLDNELNGSNIKRLLQHKMLPGILIPALEKAMNKAVLSQTAHALAATACALERYYLDKGEYPETLAQLVPHYKGDLPKDVFTGQSLIYRRNAGGPFILYSVGQNGVDDGGAIILGKGGNVKFEEGDWVWKYPTANN